MLTQNAENDFIAIDSTIVKVHKHGCAPKGGQKKEGIGKSRGGLTTKIHTVTDSLGNPLKLLLTEGNVHDSKPALKLLESCDAKAVLGDKAYGSKAILSAIEAKNAVIVIPPKSNTRQSWVYDKHLYKEHQVVECFFKKIKVLRRISTRYEKLKVTYFTFLLISSCFIWMK